MAVIPTLFRSDRLIAVNKPPGVPVIPGRDRSQGPSLRERLELELKQKVFVVHRIDRDTSGVVIFALESSSHRDLSMAFERGAVSKRYLALVKGRVEADLEVEQALVPARRNRMRVARAGERGKPAHTRLRTLELFGNASLVEAEPLTGRTHQIRVHLRHAGHPLLVDPQYGGPTHVTARDLGGDSDCIVLARTPLHAARLGLPSLRGAPEMSIDAPLAQDMEQAIQLLRERTSSQS